MRLIQKLTNSLFFRTKVLLGIVSLFAVFGTLLELSSGIWDATSHVLEEPEFFWSIQHIAVYCGVAMIVTSGIFGFILMFKKKINGTLKKGIKIIIIGSILQISAGYADSLSHDSFGIDGLVSLSHQPLELGLVLSALGAFLILSDPRTKNFSKFRPISIMTLILSISWIGFNLSLLLGNTILCLPFYEIFSSGCAIL
jgi:hypothetical protein